MARRLNKVMIIGYVGRDPEMRYTPGGTPVASFSLATDRTWTAADGSKHQATDWFNVVAWRNLAETCKQHLSKGQPTYVEGRLQTRSWKDSQGQSCYRTEIVADEVILLSDRRLSDTVPSDTDSTHPGRSESDNVTSTLNAE